MSIPIYGVTAAKVRSHHFPQLSGGFSVNSNPTAATVTEMVDDAGADLAGKLAAKGVTAATIHNAPVTYPIAYAWCAKTVRLAAAIEVFASMSGQDPAIRQAWKKELKARLDDLNERGYLALGDAPSPTQPANGPRSYVATLGLDTGDTADDSAAVPRFRRDDKL